MANIRFVRYPVTLSGDLAAVTTFRDGERAGQRYPLTLTNRTEKPQNVSLWSEPAICATSRWRFPSASASARKRRAA